MKRTTNNLYQTSQPSSDDKGLCIECQTGKLHLRYITYFTWLNDELITAPNFPAWVCDVCGKREYDPRAIQWLNTFLHPEAGKHKALRRKSRYLGVDQAQP